MAFGVDESDLDDGKENNYETKTKGIITNSGREILKAIQHNNHDENIGMGVQKTTERPEYIESYFEFSETLRQNQRLVEQEALLSRNDYTLDEEDEYNDEYGRVFIKESNSENANNRTFLFAEEAEWLFREWRKVSIAH